MGVAMAREKLEGEGEEERERETEMKKCYNECIIDVNSRSSGFN